MFIKIKHTNNRVRKAYKRTNRTRGFSLTELTLALGVLALFATVVTLSIVRGQLTSTTQKADRMVSSTLDRLVDQAATLSFPQLLDNNFKPPLSENCIDPETSCPELLGDKLIVSWSINSGGESDNSNETVDWVEIEASTQWTGTTFTSKRVVKAPTQNWRTGWGLVQVNVSGNSYDGDLYLVDSDTGKPAAGASKIINGSAWISAPLEDCGSNSNGCVIALGPYGSLDNDTITLDAISATTKIFLQQDNISHTSVILRQKGSATFALLASNGAGEIASNPHPGSLCIWASFHDGIASRYVPYCNTAQSDQITLDSYSPDPSKDWLRISLPTNWPIDLSIENNGNSDIIPTGTSEWNGTVWAPGYTKTSWTWGTPSSIAPSSDITQTSPFEGFRLELGGGVQRYNINWSNGEGTPAAGGAAFQPLWAHPRDAGDSSSTYCPANNIHCKSSAEVAPVLSSPRSGGARATSVTVIPGASNDFTLTSTDYDWKSSDGNSVIMIDALDLAGGTLVRLDQEYIEGELTTIETILGANDVIASGSDVASAPLRYYAPADSALRTFTISMLNGSGSRLVQVALATNPEPWIMRSEAVRINQGSSGVLRVLVHDTSGNPAVGKTVTPSGTALGISASTAITDQNGWATIPIEITNAVSGSSTFDLITNGITGPAYIFVHPRAGEINLAPSLTDPVLIKQGGTADVNFILLDKSGSVLANEGVAAWATRAGGGRTDDVYAATRGCETNSLGSCLIQVVATPSAPSGVYTLNVSVQGVAESLTLEVQPQARRASAPLLIIPQGGVGSLEVTILDGAGLPIEGVNVTAISSRTGLSFSSGVTNLSGVAVLSVTAIGTAQSGLHEISLSGGAASGFSYIRVNPTVTQIIANEAVGYQGELLVTQLIAKDSSGEVVPNAILTAQSTDGLIVRVESSGSDGVAMVKIKVPYSTTPSRYLVSISSNGLFIDNLSILVEKGLASATISGKVVINSQSRISLKLFDANGVALGGQEVTITSSNAAVKFSSPGGTPASTIDLVSSSDGVILLDAFSAPEASKGIFSVIINSGQTTLTAYVQLVAP